MDPQARATPPVGTTHLGQAPLAEAIAEVRWELVKEPEPVGHDPGFKVLLGRFYDHVISEFGVFKDLPPAQFPEEMTPQVVRHQFRTGEDKWPVIQLGPGVLTLNDTRDTYSWVSFFPRLLSTLKALFGSYPTDISPLRINGLDLRYLNALPLEATVGALPYIRERLHTSIAISANLFENGDQHADNASALGLQLTYQLPKLGGIGVLGLATGKRSGEDAIILDILTRARGGDVPPDIQGISDWFHAAHETCHRWFFELCDGELMNSFGARRVK